MLNSLLGWQVLGLLGGQASAPVITTESLANGTAGDAYAESIVWTGGGTIAVTSGTVPAGLTLNSNGTWSGTIDDGGVFTFTVTVTNSAGSDSAELTISVVPAVPVILTPGDGYVLSRTPTITIAAVNGATGYTYLVKDHTGATVETAPGESTSYVVATTLDNLWEYTVQVRSELTGVGNSAYSAATTFTPIAWLINDLFITTEAAPLASPRTAEPGPGTATVTDTGSTQSIAAQHLVKTGNPVSAVDPSVIYGSRSRGNGLALLAEVYLTGGQVLLGWRTDTTTTTNAGFNQFLDLLPTSLTIRDFSQLPAVGIAVTSGQTYYLMVVLKATGAYCFIKGGTEFPNWTLLFVPEITTSATVYPSLYYNTGGTPAEYTNFMRLLQLPAPFTTDNGIAQNNVTSPANAAQYTGKADQLIHCQFTLENPMAGTNGFYFRDPDQTRQNCWHAYVDSSGTFKVDKIVSGSVDSTPISVASVGANGGVRRIIVWMYGNNIVAYADPTNTYTKRGSTISDSFQATSTGFSVDKSSGATYSFIRNFPATGAGSGGVYEMLDSTFLLQANSYFGPAWHVDETSVNPPDGSATNPYTELKTALENPLLESGDTITIHGTVNIPANTTINLNASGITIAPPTGEHYRLVLGAGVGININGDNNVWWWIWRQGTDTNRTSAEDSSFPTDIDRTPFNVYGSGNRLVWRMDIDTTDSIGVWDADDTIIEGGIHINIGWDAPAYRHAHGLGYIQHPATGNPVIIRKTIGACEFNKIMKLGGSEAADQSDITVQDVEFLGGSLYCSFSNPATGIIFQRIGFWLDGMIDGQSGTGHDVTITDCDWYTTAYPIVAGGYTGSLTASGNKIARAGGQQLVMRLTDVAATIDSWSMDNNDYYTEHASEPVISEGPAGSSVSRTITQWKAAHPTIDQSSTAHTSSKFPDGSKVVNVADEYGYVRINNAVAGAASVTVDITALNLTSGHEYIARQAQDPLNDTFTFTYLSGTGADNGDGTVDFDMQAGSHSIATPIGLTNEDVTSFPDVGIWWIEPNYAL